MELIGNEGLKYQLISKQVIQFLRDGRFLHHFELYIWTMTTSKMLALLIHGGGR